MPIKVKSTNKDGQDDSKKPGFDLGNKQCDFPFNYKDKMYDNECFPGKNGDWCATKTNAKTKTVRNWAYCDYEKPEESVPEESDPPQKLKIKVKTKKKLKVVDEAKPKKTRKLKIKPLSDKYKDLEKIELDLKEIPESFLIPKQERVESDTIMLPNRKAFINWFDSTFGKYRVKKGTKFVKAAKFNYFNHQKIIRDYIKKDNPFRGLLLYHGLGVGKTCGSIAIAEGFRSNRKIVVMLNKSLRQNFRDNLKFCGYEYFRINQHWVYHKFTKNDQLYPYSKLVGIKLDKEPEGAWFIDFNKAPNYDTLSKKAQKEVDEQINKMIDDKYTFINMDGLNEKKLKSMVEKKALNNTILVVDEVHNLTNAMAKSKPGIRAKYLEQLIMEAEDLKLVFLSGTPMINTLFETAKLFNLLRGKIISYDMNFNKKKSGDINWNMLETTLKTDSIIDQYFLDKRNNFVSVSRVPKGFVKTDNGFQRNELMNNYTEEQFYEYLNNIMPSSVKVNKKEYTAFPNTEEEFLNLFYDTDKNAMKNLHLFKSRILGLVSYYRTQDKTLIPVVKKNEVVNVPMSEYQFLNYAKVRKAEIDQDKSRKRNQKKKKGKKDNEDDMFEAKSSYRAYSRMHCSFVFPAEIPRPYPTDENGEIMDEFSENMEFDSEFVDIEEDEAESEKKKLKLRMAKYEIAKGKTLKQLEKNKLEHLVQGNPEKLLKYSPKYDIIVDSIKKNKGLSFVYTEYKTLEGIAVFSIVLKANGYAPFILKKNDDGEYIQVYEKPEDKDKPKYAFWGGKADESDLIRKVYNNDFDELPKTLRDQLKATGKNNLRGDIVKVLLTTKTGAEGIDLHNVRQVHIVEPYWNPVRIKQVKGRAVRVGSHLQLPPDERNVEIFTYLAIITPKLKKMDRAIEMDSNGQTSDEALYELSQKKLRVMDTLLRLIKEASIDCSINFNDTYDTDEPFTCVNYGSNPSRDNYSFVPDISKQFEDKEQTRRTIKSTWKPKIITLNIKGDKKQFALKPAPPDEPQLLYDLSTLKESGRPGMPIGEIKLTEEGKKKVVLYPKAKTVLSGKRKKSKKKNKKVRRRSK